MTVKLYTAESLSNEEYRALPQLSGTELSIVYNQCPAALLKERKETKALINGIDIHACILEPKRFKEEYFKGFDYSCKEFYSSESAVKAKLKEEGVPKYSTKKGNELFQMLLDIEPTAIIKPMQDIKDELEAGERKIISHESWMMFCEMREAVLRNPDARNIIENAVVEMSFVSDDLEYYVKSRPDIITTFGSLDDYKTAGSAKPSDFFRSAYNYGYLLKEACKHDMFEKHYGEKPARHTFIVQEKEFPYISAVYELDEDALNVGRKQYLSAMHKALDVREKGVYDGYQTQVFEVPGFAKELFEE